MLASTASKLFLVTSIATCSLNALGSPADQIEALSESNRMTIFQKLLSSSGERCSQVTRTFLQGKDKTGAAFWGVQCTGSAYQVMVENNAKGSTKVMDCKVVKMLGMDCFSKFR